MSVLQARSALRESIKRLVSAVRKPTEEVTIRRRDLEVLLAFCSEKKLDGKMPNLHPEQR